MSVSDLRRLQKKQDLDTERPRRQTPTRQPNAMRALGMRPRRRTSYAFGVADSRAGRFSAEDPPVQSKETSRWKDSCSTLVMVAAAMCSPTAVPLSHSGTTRMCHSTTCNANIPLSRMRCSSIATTRLVKNRALSCYPCNSALHLTLCILECSVR